MGVDYTVDGDSFRALNPRPWSEHQPFVPSSGAQHMDLAPDGKHFVIFDWPVGAAQPNTHATFLLNFFDELRRRAPEGR